MTTLPKCSGLILPIHQPRQHSVDQEDHAQLARENQRMLRENIQMLMSSSQMLSLVTSEQPMPVDQAQVLDQLHQDAQVAVSLHALLFAHQIHQMLSRLACNHVKRDATVMSTSYSTKPLRSCNEECLSNRIFSITCI